MSLSSPDFVKTVARAVALPERAVGAVVSLLSEGATIPFIARYRKELTGALDEVQLRAIAGEHEQQQQLWQRKRSIIDSIEKQGELTAELRQRIEACSGRPELEDLYLPFKKRRRTRAQVARERGLEPLAQRILAQPRERSVEQVARAFVNPEKEVPDIESALAGACDIAAEIVAERADVRALCRAEYEQHALLRASVVKKAAASGPTKYEQYYDFSEPVRRVPSHRILAIRRGEQEGVLRAKIATERPEQLVERILRTVGYDARSPFAKLLRDAVEDGFQRLLSGSMENEVGGHLKARADADAISVFAQNLKQLLLAAPLGGKTVLGIDPGFRTGCKCVVVDATGTLQAYETIYPTGNEQQAKRAAQALVQLVARYGPAAIAVGNGTAGRETMAFVQRSSPKGSAAPMVVSVNEAGASVYSASETARREFPDLDVTYRGAVSIARRLQDPLAELVKIDPQAIGVGQYQHDVPEAKLRAELSAVVESAVNHVGVELNTASAELLSHVAGLGEALARSIVAHREANGPFAARRELLAVPKLGKKTFEQAAGFLRIHGARHPLDASAVHPERYPVVERMARDLGVKVAELLRNESLLARIELEAYVDEQAGLGLLTLRDILAELRKPGRDPRERFEAPRFREGVNTLEDVKEGMTLEGVVTNVAAFGAFVDVGVHQDGLVHISQLADRFVKDPAEVVKVGDRVTARVISIDLQRRRISLSLRS